MNHDEKIIYVVDDDPAVLDSMTEMLAAAGLRGSAHHSSESFLAAFDARLGGCVVIDICLPGLDGLELCEFLCEKHSHVPVIMITGHADVAKTRRSFKMGAVDFVEKPFSSRQLLALIRETLNDHHAEHRDQIYQAEVLAKVALLSKREREVMDMVIGGLLNKQIAATLGVHERTVEFHRQNLMRKMGAESVPQLVAMILACKNRLPPIRGEVPSPAHARHEGERRAIEPS